jgi:peptidyl-prolyl cis-trans isomerase A (cyclophilin A)
MKMLKMFRTALVAAICVTFLLASATAAADQQDAPAPPPNPALLDPSLATATAPDTYKVRMQTTTGSFVIEVHRDWAPNGADRFYNLVTIGYYNDVAFYRVLKGFMAQTGMHGNPAVTAAWSVARIPPDAVKQSNTKGRVTFAMGGSPDTRTTQIFINYGNNSYLDDSGFAPFGEVVEGFETVNQLYSGYGEGQPNGNGPSQAKFYRGGNDYIKGSFPKLDFIVTASIVE